jgi:hypothetical protein
MLLLNLVFGANVFGDRILNNQLTNRLPNAINETATTATHNSVTNPTYPSSVDT